MARRRSGEASGTFPAAWPMWEMSRRIPSSSSQAATNTATDSTVARSTKANPPSIWKAAMMKKPMT